ncbi:DNA-binding protein [Brucella intermedia]|uniref:DNA-binding protein n=1 Tax=Brucella intermedia TaxID=94625 RepID=UPI0024468434|nr:DNA-binding protein [Brucella intermedia]WGG58225.1 DNA-binding protein [Brucella intermedia]
MLKPSTEDMQTADVIWGTEEIAAFIGQTVNATSYMLRQRQIPARKIGDRWVASRKKLNEFFAGEAA